MIHLCPYKCNLFIICKYDDMVNFDFCVSNMIVFQNDNPNMKMNVLFLQKIHNRTKPKRNEM